LKFSALGFIVRDLSIGCNQFLNQRQAISSTSLPSPSKQPPVRRAFSALIRISSILFQRFFTDFAVFNAEEDVYFIIHDVILSLTRILLY